MSICYRSLRKDDYQALRIIIGDTWKFSEDLSAEDALRRYQKAYLYSHLAWSNYSEVAVADGKVVAFLIGRCNYIAYWKHFIHFLPLYMKEKLCLFFTKDGRNALHIIKITERVNNKLIKGHVNDFDGELCLFAVAADYKRRGIGRGLLDHFHAFMKENGAENYFLYTDTYCDFNFYERMNYSLISLDTVDFGDGEEKKPKFILYEYDLTNITEKDPKETQIRIT